MKGRRLADDICTRAKRSQRKWQLLWKKSCHLKWFSEEKQGVNVCRIAVKPETRDLKDDFKKLIFELKAFTPDVLDYAGELFLPWNIEELR